MIEITNFKQLKKFILNNSLTNEQMAEVIHSTLKVWISGEYENEELVEMLEVFIKKYPTLENRRLFLDKEENEELSVFDFGYRKPEH